MYLNELKEEQKKLFLDLSVSLSMSDGDFSQQEKNLISQLCREMNIKEEYSTENRTSEIISKIATSATDREKRIVAIELAGLVMVDNKYSESEQKIMADVAEAFGINYIEIEKMIHAVSELYEVYCKFANFLSGKL